MSWNIYVWLGTCAFCMPCPGKEAVSQDTSPGFWSGECMPHAFLGWGSRFSGPLSGYEPSLGTFTCDLGLVRLLYKIFALHLTVIYRLSLWASGRSDRPLSRVLWGPQVTRKCLFFFAALGLASLAPYHIMDGGSPLWDPRASHVSANAVRATSPEARGSTPTNLRMSY
jgi:hypothetical protein